MHTGRQVIKTNLAQQVNTAPFSPPSPVRYPYRATQPDKVDITAALHMASLVDEYRSHSGCPLPSNPCLRSRPPRYSKMYQHIFDRG
jgi:hypothetical protein